MRVSTLSETSVVVQWSPPELLERNGPIEGYEVTLIYKNGTRRAYPISGSTFNFQVEGIAIATIGNVSRIIAYESCSLVCVGLPKFAELNITVAARTTAGLGPVSLPTPANFNELGQL